MRLHHKRLRELRATVRAGGFECGLLLHNARTSALRAPQNGVSKRRVQLLRDCIWRQRILTHLAILLFCEAPNWAR